MGQPVFVGKAYPAHQPAVGAKGHRQATIEIAPNRMFGCVADHMGLEVAGEIDLHRDPAITDNPFKALVLEQPRPMPQAHRVAPGDRLGDRLRAGRFSSVDGDPEPAGQRDVERRPMDTGHPAGLSAGQVERHHAVVPHPDRMFRNPHRDRRVVVAERAIDDPGLDAELPFATGKPPLLGHDDLVERQALAGTEVGAISNFEIPEVVEGGVFDHLVGDLLDRLGGLEQRDGEVEPLEELLEIVGIVHHHVPPQRIRLRGREYEARIPGEVNHGAWPERPVEVDVQLRLGKPRDQVTGDHRPRRRSGEPTRSPGGWRPRQAECPARDGYRAHR